MTHGSSATSGIHSLSDLRQAQGHLGTHQDIMIASGQLQTPVNDTKRPVLRFAPSPNGYLHAGHAFSALLNERLARELGGVLLLRIEDIDVTRCRPEYAAALLEDLDWLGVQFDGAPLRQSERFGLYGAYLQKLADDGLIYRCFCSRADIAAATKAAGIVERDPDGAPRYTGTCRRRPDRAPGREEILPTDIPPGLMRPFALRLDMSRAMQRAMALTWGMPLTMRRFAECSGEETAPVDPLAWGDVILARKETPTSYHVSVTVDDALQGVTHVARGRDLEAATAIHRLLQTLWGFAAPAYLHHHLVRDAAGEKLAKSLGSKPLRALRAEGVTAQELRRSLGF